MPNKKNIFYEYFIQLDKKRTSTYLYMIKHAINLFF